MKNGRLMGLNFSILILLALVGFDAIATGELAQTFTLDGRLYADPASTTALTDPDVTLVFQILNPLQNCILYEETQAHFNAAVGNGYFTLQIGSNVGNAKRSSLDSAHAMSMVYSNASGGISGRTVGGGACVYFPTLGDVRFVRVLVTPSSDGVTRTLSPSMSLDSVPMAVVAERAESVQGLAATDLLQVNNSGSAVLSQTNLENIFSSSNYPALISLLAGSSGLYSKPAANGTTPLANVTSPASPAAGQIWYDGGAIKFYDGSSTQTLGTAGSGISAVVAGVGLNVGAGPGGTIASTGTLNVDIGTTTGKIVQVASGNKLPVIDGSNLTNLPAPSSVSGSAIFGTIGGSTAINTSGAIATTGNITGATLSGGSVVGTTGSFASISTGQVSLYDSPTTNTNYVTLKTPDTATFTTDYTLTLPAAPPGSSGQVLTSDPSGILSWIPASSGSVVSVGGTAPVTIGGTASAPVLGVASATTSDPGVVTLAASGGTTASTVVQATDIRLSDSRAPSGSAGGDLSGNYPAPILAKIGGTALSISSLTLGDHLKYNGSSWVNSALSSADLSDDSDLLKASHMPAHCAAGSSLSFSSPTGTWVCTAIPDATTVSKGIVQVGAGLSISSGTVSLTSGVMGTPGAYQKVTVDTYGRVTAGASLSSGDITAALGYTPLNKAGDAVTGPMGFPSYTNTAEVTLTSSFGALDKGKIWFNSDLKKMHLWDGAGIVSMASPLAPTAAQDGQSLKWNQATKTWDYFTASASTGIGTLNGLTANTQNFAVSDGGTAPAFSSTSSTHTLNIPLASASGAVTAGLISNSDYVAFNAKLGSTSSLVGDVTGTPSATSVDKIKGKAVTAPTVSGQMLVYDGAGLKPVAMTSDATMVASGAVTLKNTGTAGTYYKVTTDAQGRVTNGVATLNAADIPNLDAAKITSGTVADARLPSSATYWQAATGGIQYGSGNVGIGTTAPGQKLDVVGNIKASGSIQGASFSGSGSGLTGTAASLTAGAANSVAWGNVSGKPFNWAGQGGQPSWLWGSNDGSNYYVWNPSNFNVNYANSAGNSSTVGGHSINQDLNTYNSPTFANQTIAGTLTVGYNSIQSPSHYSDGAYWLHVNGNLQISGGGATCFAGHTTGGMGCASDARLKTDVHPIPNSLRKLMKVRGVTFHWIEPSKSGPENVGLIAQEVEAQFPQIVKEISGIKTVDYGAMVSPIIEAVKELYLKWRADSKELHKVTREISSEAIEIQEQLLGQARQIARLNEELAALKETSQDREAEILKLKSVDAELRGYLCSKDASTGFCK